jgi:pimeloyl-ACP methyl ester carboxylesterase
MLRAFAASRTPIGPIVETLSVPVTFIYGENDWMTPANGVEAGA